MNSINLKIRTKLLVTALALSFIPMIIIGGFALLKSQEAFSNQAFEHLESIREIKKAQLESFFVERESDMHVLLDMVANFKQNAFQTLQAVQSRQKAQLEWYFYERLNNIRVLSKNHAIAQAIEQFHEVIHAKNDNHKTLVEENWQSIEHQFGSELKQYQEGYGYDDLFLITKDGHIVYTVKRGAELGKNVLSGVLKNSHLNQAFQKGLNGVAIQDFALYALANNQYVAFMTAPIFHNDELVGVWVFSLLPDAINAIVQKREGIGETEETYLVGQWNDQTSYRSDRIITKNKGNIGDKKSGADIDNALVGQSGVTINIAHSDQLELSAYAPLQIPHLHWCIITTINFEEVLVPKLMDEQEDFFTKYVRQYGYYDLFLISPKGKIFYTVKQESDYQTNLLTGKYAHSGLAQMFKKVLQTKAFAMSDFAPYAPSRNEPTTFFAQPLLSQGGIELVVALQLNDKAINQIMQQRTGMGKSGETYLVGSDKLMRSNTLFNPNHHSTKSVVDTEASNKALSGETGTKIIKNYRDVSVLSAYTPIKIGETRWALIAEIEQAKAFTVFKIFEWFLSIMVLSIGFILLFLISRAIKRLTKPLLLANEHLKMLAQGKVVDDDIEYRQNDEIGELVNSTNRLKSSIKNSIAQAHAIAAGDYNKEIKWLSKQNYLGQALVEMTDVLRESRAQKTRQDWLKSGQAQLNELMSGEQEIDKLAKKIIAFLCKYVEAQVGLFYLLKEPESENQKPYLHIIASYAYTKSDDYPQQFLLGEGIVGEVALERKTLFRIHTPEEYAHIIQSGMSQIIPRYVILLPFLYENAVKGVIELGFSEMLTETQGEFLEQMMPSIGITVNTAESRTKMHQLLAKSQRQSETLQKQQEELQHKQVALQRSNTELQNQAEKLQSQSEELQSQQEELRQTNEALEERTQDLERQKAKIQQKNRALEKTTTEMEKAQAAIETKAQELELASKYKSEFLANMSHELRTPLNSMLILAQLLAANRQNNLLDKQVEYANTIHSAGTDLLKLINDILDLSKIEAGKVEVNIEEVLLVDLMKTIEQKFSYVAEEKGVAFHITMAENLPTLLYTDGQRLKQIINNLLSNAFKFTNEGKVEVSIERSSTEDKFIALNVTDTGIGIHQEKQKVIFEAFQQADGTTSRRYGGTGLGLSISRQLARLLGGDLILVSEESKGSTFTLYLPEGCAQASTSTYVPDLPKDSATANIPAKAPLSTLVEIEPLDESPIVDDRNELQASDKSILIIEDDRKFSNLIMELAQGKDFKCLVAEDGSTGLQLAEQYQPDAIILDVSLPQLDGLKVMERLKDNPDTRHIPVHFMSAADQSMDAKKMGAIGYLLKPVSMEQLGDAFKTIELFLAKTMKNLLVVVDIELHQQKIVELVGDEDVQIKLAPTIASAFHQLQTTTYDCIILDMDIEQSSGSKLLEQMQTEANLCHIPMIVYAERDLTPIEETLLSQCSDKLPIKSVKSAEHLLDETTLFLHQVQAKLPADKRNMLRMRHDKEAILRHKKVLIVDDDMRNTYALATALEDKEMEVVSSNNGKQGVATLEKYDDIALVLMDIMMPEMDGYEAIRAIRQQPRYQQLPIIALTAKAMKGDKAKCIEAGANDYLAKPVDTEKLFSLMRVWLYR